MKESTYGPVIFIVVIIFGLLFFVAGSKQTKSYVKKPVENTQIIDECSIYRSGWEVCESQLSACGELLNKQKSVSYDYIEEALRVHNGNH